MKSREGIAITFFDFNVSSVMSVYVGYNYLVKLKYSQGEIGEVHRGKLVYWKPSEITRFKLVVVAAARKTETPVFRQCEQDVANVIFQRHTRLIIPQSYGNDMTDGQTGSSSLLRISFPRGAALKHDKTRLKNFLNLTPSSTNFFHRRTWKNVNAVYTRCRTRQTSLVKKIC